MIKVTLGEVKPQEKPFPRMMANKNGCIRLVFGDLSSLILVSVSGEDFEINNKGSWDIDQFFDYNDPITIQNEIG